VSKIEEESILSASEMFPRSSAHLELYLAPDMIIGSDTLLPEGWEEFMTSQKEELQRIVDCLSRLRRSGVIFYPKVSLLMRPFFETKLEDVRIVIVGQEPYRHDIADGLAFSSKQSGCRIPASLSNVYDENEGSVERFRRPSHCDLTTWARRGVLLLNASLTVQEDRSMSHVDCWRGFVGDCVKLCSGRGSIAFLLLGRDAQWYEKFVDAGSNLLLKTSHPSPHSVNQGFRGSEVFAKMSAYHEIDFSI